MNTVDTTLSDVIEVIGEALGIEDRVGGFLPSTPLLGDVPELDSQGVVLLLVALEDRFGFEIDDADFSGATFETVGSLADYVASRRA